LKYGASPEKLFRLVKHTYGKDFSDSELISYLTTFARRFITQQFKRSCSPDGPKVCEVGLSPRAGWNAPSDASPAVWLREIEKLK
jgi:NAD+ synthase (glutamine-hydrolysing)